MNDPLLRAPLGRNAVQVMRRPPPSGPPHPRSRVAALAEELSAFAGSLEPRRLAWQAARWVPDFVLSRSRARALALVGCRVPYGTAIGGFVHLIGPRGCATRLSMGPGCIVGPDVTFGLDESITLGKNVSIGPRAVLYTATHPIGLGDRRMDLNLLARPIVVGDGAWIGFGALVLPGVRVGRGAVIAAGAVVNADVPEDVLVAGNPATVTQELPTRSLT